jgi:hypothetical protein
MYVVLSVDACANLSYIEIGQELQERQHCTYHGVTAYAPCQAGPCGLQKFLLSSCDTKS